MVMITARSGWAEAVQEIIDITGISQASVADSAGLEPPTLNRYLRRKSNPSPARVIAVNDAIANLVHDPGVRDYLSAIGAEDQTLKGFSGDPRVEQDFEDEIESAARHMRAGFREAFLAHLQTVPSKVRREAMLRLVQEFRLRLIRGITGVPRKNTRLYSFMLVSRKLGFDATSWLVSEREIEIDQQRDAFEQTVQTVLSGVGLTIPERLRCEREIMAAFRRHLTSIRGGGVK